jgi:hypothetical protein
MTEPDLDPTEVAAALSRYTARHTLSDRLGFAVELLNMREYDVAEAYIRLFVDDLARLRMSETLA